jgi:TonB family protein
MQRALVAAAFLAVLASPAGAVDRSSAPDSDRETIVPDWAAKPSAEDMEREYPPEAVEKGVSGYAKIRCTVEPDGTLLDCDILEERPDGMGFGPATIKATRYFRMKPYKAALIRNQLPQVVIPVRWEMPKPPAPAAQSASNAASAQDRQLSDSAFLTFIAFVLIAIVFAVLS